MLFSRIRITEHSWDRLFGWFEIPTREIGTPIQRLEEILDGNRHPIDYPRYVRRRWLFGLIQHLELVSLGDYRSIEIAYVIGHLLHSSHSEHLLLGLQTMHITEAYTARVLSTVSKVEDVRASEWNIQEGLLALLCPSHKLCIHIPKDDTWTPQVSYDSTIEQIDAAYKQAYIKGLRVMAGDTLLVNATDITIHNASMRHVTPPRSHQIRNLRLSYLSPKLPFGDNQSSVPETVFPRALQIADFLFEAFHQREHRAPPPRSVTIFRPLLGSEPMVSQELKLLKKGVMSWSKGMSREMETADREKFLRQVDSVEWVLESQMPKGELGIFDVCNGE